MGYANLKQTGRGIHTRQFARAFVVEDEHNSRVAFVSADSGMIGYGIKREVSQVRLRHHQLSVFMIHFGLYFILLRDIFVFR